MSVVTNVILLTFIDDKGVHGLQQWLADKGMPPLKKIDENAGGNKMIEHDFFAGAFNHLDLEGFVQCAWATTWTYPKEVQLFVKEENDEVFSCCLGPILKNRFFYQGSPASVT